MKNQLIATLLTRTICATLICTSPLAVAKEKSDEKRLNFARDYVLASCISHAYPDTPLANEAKIWAGGIVELGDGLSSEDFPALAALAKQAPAPLSSKQGVPMRMKNCLDFVRGASFNARLRKTLKR